MGSLRSDLQEFWVVYHGSRPVARAGFQIQTKNKPRTLHFGYFECAEGYADAARMLLSRGSSLAPEAELFGPYQFQLEEPYSGVLVKGFEHDPVFLSSHNPPFYEDYLLRAGLEPAMDLLSYQYLPGTVKLDRMAKRAARAAKAGVSIRSMNRKQMGQDMQTCLDIFNKAWKDNWGFERASTAELKTLLWFSRLFFDRRGILFAEHKGRAIGFQWVLRDFNVLLKQSKGRFTPRLLWDFCFGQGKIQKFRGYALGVLPEYLHLNVTPALVHEIMSKGHHFDWREFEVGWVLSTNTKMNALARALGGVNHKTHRVFRKRALG